MKSLRVAVIIMLVIMLGIILALSAPIAINNLIEGAVAELLEQSYGLSNCTIRVDSNLSSLLSGSVNSVSVWCPEGYLSGVKIKNLTALLENIKFGLGDPTSSGRFTLKEIGSANIRAAIGEDEINRYVIKSNSDLSGWQVYLKPNRIIAHVEAKVIGGIDIAFEPRILGKSLVLEPVDTDFTESPRAGSLSLKKWVKLEPISIELGSLPFGMELTELVVEDGQLIFVAGS